MFVTDTHTVIATRDADVARELRARVEIIDALYRFALGQDLKDRALLVSAFAEDAQLDFRPAARKWGGEVSVMVGREAIADTILGLFGNRVDTTHQVTNPRVRIDGPRAHLTALVEAQHLLSHDPETHALLKNPYDVELVQDAHRWLIHRMTIHNTWLVGDPRAIFEP